ncbi:hypothetical protein Ocin01_12395, partial [Orchesella cincta]
ISIAFLVYSVPTEFGGRILENELLYDIPPDAILPARLRGIPPGEDEELADPATIAKWEEFRMNITSKEKNLFSCFEDQTYSAINDFINCHLFCPLCNQGYGRCEMAGDMRMCICDCEFSELSSFLNFECPWIYKWCSRVAESQEQALKLTRCQNECQDRGYLDGALCGADMEDPPILRSTCTCLC